MPVVTVGKFDPTQLLATLHPLVAWLAVSIPSRIGDGIEELGGFKLLGGTPLQTIIDLLFPPCAGRFAAHVTTPSRSKAMASIDRRTIVNVGKRDSIAMASSLGKR
jgi:hypothetical protein